MTPPGPEQILVRNRAVAIHPVDRYKQQMGNLMFIWIKFPFIFGYDLAGEVIGVGPGVTRFKVGGRVLATATGMDKPRNRAAEGAFQLFTLVRANMAAKTPGRPWLCRRLRAAIGAVDRSDGPLRGRSAGLEPALGQPGGSGQDRADPGAGSTSVGCKAIQLAKAAGYQVVTTASPANFALVRGLGAAEMFDHHSPVVVEDVRRAVAGTVVGGALAMGQGSVAAGLTALQDCKGQRKVAMATFPLAIDSLPERPGPGTALMHLLPTMVLAGATMWLKSRHSGVAFSVIFGTALADTDLSRAIFEVFLPDALQRGTFVAAPDPLIVGHGLDCVQAAFDRHRQGVSAGKVVVTL